jgi:hypothetical protein
VIGLTAVEPLPLKLTVSGALPVVIEGTLEALTPLAIFGVASMMRRAKLTPAGAGTPKAALRGPLPAPSSAQSVAAGTAKLFATTVPCPVPAS